MKKVLLTLITIFAINAVASAQAENYRAFKVDVMGGLASPSGVGLSSGLTISVEPKYNLSDNIAVGVQFATSLFGTSVSGGSIGAFNNYSAVGEYYLGESKVRPFAGIGLGIYSGGSVSFAGQTVTGGSNFGFAPRAGVQLGHFRIAAEYNLVKDSNFLTLKAGFTIGGGAN
jgi:hypothetical protein